MQSVIVRKKMLARVFLVIFAILTAFLLVLSTYTYYATRTVILNTISAQNSSLSSQADTFTQQFYKMVRNYGINVFYSRSMTRLRSDSKVDNSDLIESMRELRTYASSTDYIHSIVLYNGNEDYIYCTLDSDLNKGSAFSDDFFDSAAVKLLKQAGSSAPVVRDIDAYGKRGAVISFPFYETEGDTVRSSMIVNVSLSWLEQFLSSILGLENTSIYLGNGAALLENPDAASFFAADSDMLHELLDESNINRYLIRLVDGQRYICFCARNAQLDWYFIRVVPYNYCLSAALKLRLNLVMLTATMAVAAVFTGFLIFKKFFTPVDKLLETLPAGSIDPSTVTVSQALSHASAELRNYSALMRSEFLQKLILISSENCSEQLLLSKEIYLNPGERVHLLMVSADKTLPDMEGLVPSCRCESVEVLDNHIIIAQGSDIDFIKYAQLIGRTAAFCAYADNIDFQAIHDIYVMLCDIYGLRFFLPGGTTHTLEVLCGRGDTQYPRRLEMRITVALTAGDSKRAMSVLEEFIALIADVSSYSSLHSHLKQLYMTVSEMDGNDGFSGVDSGAYFDVNYKTFTSRTDLMCFYNVLFACVSERSVKQKALEERALIDRVKKCVEDNFFDTNLSSSYIADLEGVSNDSLCELFKNREHNTLPKYITQYRLERSCELLRSTNMPVTGVAQAVGFATPQYFFTVFKANFNVTPAKYRDLSG